MNREIRRFVVAMMLLLGFLGIVVWAIVIWTMEIPEVDLDPIDIEMEDPFPCSVNKLARIAYQRQGAICNG